MKTLPALVAAVLAFASTGAFAQTVVYRETFSTTTNNSNTSTVGWGVHYGSASVYTNADLSNAVAVSNLTGRVTGVDNVNAGATGTQNSAGFMFVGTQITPILGVASLIWTNEAAVSLSTSTLSEFSFYLGNTSGAAPVRLAVQVGSAWYASETTFSTANMTGGEFGANAELKTLAFSGNASSWRTLTFAQAGSNPLTTAGTGNLSLGALAVSDLSGTVNAFGIYVGSGSTNNVRFDTFTITAIPEPSAFAALAGVAMLGLAAFRRRR